ncbi:flagellar hook protein FlgE [Neobacillus terrae]|uniref:flagellar hook protein FlgE n=1 Tax=Neobacillus terrae TaxID=3034837 RepID=UPI00140C5786|nr:flagellar hook-basal body complex protein [Neobacillus terrae]NHM29800.1 flagellar hook-basal body complex protein [Neobacillus terrae]
MLRSMYSGISGMKNFQTKLDVIGNNIANVNTFGFKKGRVTFKDTMNQTISGASAAQNNRGGKNPMQVGLGSTFATIDTVDTQAALQTTGRALDVAISGDGYFVTKQGNQLSYTRAGNFYLDNSGNLVNGDGLKVQAYKVDPVTGQPTNQLGDIAVNVNAVLPPVVTKNIKMADNLSADAIVGTVYNQQIKTIDAQGQEQKMEISFTKSASGWDVTIPGAPTNPTSLSFGADKSCTTGALTYTPAGSAPITVDFSGLKQEAGPTTALVNPDGNLQGSLESFNIGSSGAINGVYSNGLVKTLGILAIAKFSNASGLTKTGSNSFQESINSGTANIGTPGDGRGSIAAGSLEMSNVDLSEEFTEMITAQRGFQANTKIITTSDEILQELVNLKR